VSSVRSQRQRTADFGLQDYPTEWPEVAATVRAWSAGQCVRCRHRSSVAAGTVLTVHHLTMEKANLSPWNLMAACQRCHLSVQARVDFDQPYLGAHKQWMAPFVMARQFCDAFEIDLSAGPAADPGTWAMVMKAIIALATAGRPVCECEDWTANHSSKATK